MGCVLQAGAGMNVARQAALKAGVPVDVPGETINRVCGSGLQAVVHAVEAIRVGYVDTVVAGGTESMSNAPYLLEGARWGYRMGNATAVDSMLHEGLTCAINACHMGITAEDVAERYGVSRADQDAFAAESQRRAAEAIRQRELQGRDRAGRRFPSEGRRTAARRYRRISARRDDGRHAGRAEAGVQERRDGHGRQCFGDQRRRRGAGRDDRATRRGVSGRRRWRASSRTPPPASIRRSWASGRFRRFARRSSGPV